MSRILRLFACAIGMLAAAVLACMLLQDEEAVNVGHHTVSGRIAGMSGETPMDSSASKEKSEEAARPEQNGEAQAARVRVLELARAAAENQARARNAEALRSEELKTEAKYGAGEAEGLPAEKAGTAPKAPSAVEAEALELLAGETPRKAAPAEISSKAAAPRAEARPVRDAASSRVVAEKAEKPETKKPEVRKAETKKAEKKAEKKSEAAPTRRLSAVEAALADARSGRLAPGDEFITHDDPAASYDRVITSARFSMKGSLIKLTLRGNSPMIGHFYVLESPDRVVLDLAGNWQVDMPKVPSNRLIASVRVGQHEDKTRLVFDMKEMGKVALVPLNRNALELRIW